MSVMFEITNQKTLEEVMRSSYDIIILDIYADWCQPCKYLTPKLEDMARQYASSNILFCKLNSDTQLKSDLKGLPTVEFWVTDSNNSKKLHHTVLGADINEITQVLSSLTDPNYKPQSQPQQTPQTAVPQMVSMRNKMSGSGSRDAQYKSYKNY